MIITMGFGEVNHYSDRDDDRTACGLTDRTSFAHAISDEEAIAGGVVITCKNCRRIVERNWGLVEAPEEPDDE